MMTEEKQKELIKLRELNLATLDYNLQLCEQSSVQGFDLVQHFKNLKSQVQQYYEKGNINLLRRWFNYFTEGIKEAGFECNKEYSRYIKARTGYDVDILQCFYNRVNKIVVKGKITTQNQYRDIDIMVNELCQATPIDKEKIDKLNNLLLDYCKRKEAKDRN